MANLEQLKKPGEFLNRDVDMRGRPLFPPEPADLHKNGKDKEKDQLLGHLLDGTVDNIKEPLAVVLTEVELVLKRQLKSYLEQEPTSEMLQKTKSAPVHNMQAEQLLGMADYQVNRAANATPEYIEAKLKYKK